MPPPTQDLEELRTEVCKSRHSGALLTQEDAKCKQQAVTVRGFEKLTALEALSGAKLLCEADSDLVELCFDLCACLRCQY